MREEEPLTPAELHRRRGLVDDARAALDAVGLGRTWTSSWIDSLAEGGPGLDVNTEAPAMVEDVLQPFIGEGLVVRRRTIVFELE